MTKILLLSSTARPAGSERAVLGLASRLPAHGFEIETVLLEDGALARWLQEAECPYTILDAGRVRHIHRTVAAVRALRRHIAFHGLAAVISSQSKAHLYGGLAARAADVPAVWWQHVIPGRIPLELVAARVRAMAVVCVSAESARAQRRVTPGADVRLIHPGIALDKVVAARGRGVEIREQLGWKDRPLIGIVGRLQPWKGQTVFLRAMAQLAEEFSEARFVVVGGAILGSEGSYPGELRRLAEKLNLEEQVHFAGHQDDVYGWMDAFDIAVHASLGEPFGLVVVEAMALGKPVIASALGGPTEIVEDGRSGLLVPPGDDRALADAVRRVLRNGELAARLGSHARERAAEFSDSRMAERFAGLLREILGQARPARTRSTGNARQQLGVSMVIPTYRRPGHLRRCLDSVRAQRVPPAEVVVVHRSDDDESLAAMEAARAGAVAVTVDRPGVLAAMRVGAEATSGDVLAFVDDDVALREDWIERVLECFRDPAVGAVGGRDVTHPPRPGDPTSDVGRITRWGKLVGNHHLGVGGARDVHVLKGCNMAFRREALALPRGLRGSGAEVHYEVATCLWALQRGWRLVYDPDLVVDHYAADRFDGYGRAPLPTHGAMRDAAYNLVAALLGVEPELRARRALYGLLVGDAGAPGIVRVLAAVLRRERRVVLAFVPSMRGQAAALHDVLLGRTIVLLPIGPAASAPPEELEGRGSADPVHRPPRA